MVMKVKTGQTAGGRRGRRRVREEERWEPLDAQPVCCVVLCCVVLCLCACAHGPAVFSSLSVPLRLPAGRMRRGAKEGGGGKEE